MHFARSAEDQIFADELAAITEADNGVDVRLFHGDALFSAELLGRIVPAFAETDTWTCGPAGMVDLVRAAYGENNPRLRLEFFKTPPTTAGNAAGSLGFARAGQVVANSGASILEQAEATGSGPRVRLPDGHLLLLHCAQDLRHRPQRDHRRRVLAAR